MIFEDVIRFLSEKYTAAKFDIPNYAEALVYKHMPPIDQLETRNAMTFGEEMVYRAEIWRKTELFVKILEEDLDSEENLQEWIVEYFENRRNIPVFTSSQMICHIRYFQLHYTSIANQNCFANLQAERTVD
jgi:hypothetical protein